MKKYFVLALGVILAISVSAFAVKEKHAPARKPTTTLMWFDFSGSSESDYNNLSLYTQDPNHQNPCTGAGLRCEVYAPVIETGPNAGKPDLTAIEDETFRE